MDPRERRGAIVVQTASSRVDVRLGRRDWLFNILWADGLAVVWYDTTRTIHHEETTSNKARKHRLCWRIPCCSKKHPSMTLWR